MISVLVVSHDSRDHLRCSLAEVKRLAPAAELLVVDCASSDGSARMVREEHPTARLLALSENVGFGVANNRAAELASGDRLLLLNPDAWPQPGCLDALSSALDADPRLALAAPQLVYPDGRLQFGWAPATSVLGEAVQKLRNRVEHRSIAHGRLAQTLLRPTGAPWYTAACALLRRSAFEAVGGFDPAIFLYFEDVDLCLRLRRAGWRLALIPDATAVHIKGASGGGQKSELEYRRAQLYFYGKHRPRWEQALLRQRLRLESESSHDPELRSGLRRLLGLPPETDAC